MDKIVVKQGNKSCLAMHKIVVKHGNKSCLAMVKQDNKPALATRVLVL